MVGTPPTTEVQEFPPDVESAGAARRFVARVCPVSDAELADRIAFLVSEVVTNAILHARTPFVVRAHRDGTLRVEVADGSTTPPVRKDYGPQAATGRGVRIVDRLSDRWGTEVSATGKVVWFEVELESERERIA